jgi:hypothetical protein
MNLVKFQLCLNHDDPDIVQQGLDAFRDVILKQHSLVLTFGTYGWSQTTSTVELLEAESDGHQLALDSLLISYLRASPKLEELFILWNLPNRKLLANLCLSHNLCIAAIILCLYSPSTANSRVDDQLNVHDVCRRIVYRLVNEHIDSIKEQIEMKDENLTKASICLLLFIARAQKKLLMNDGLTTDTTIKLHSIIKLFEPLIIIKSNQKKSILENETLIDDQKRGCTPDIRSLIILYLVVLLKLNHSEINSELLHSNAIFMKIIQSILKYPSSLIKFILEGFILIGNKDPLDHTSGVDSCPPRFLIINSSNMKHFLQLYAYPNESIQLIFHLFMKDYIHFILQKHSKTILNNIKSLLSLIVASLQPYQNPRHLEVMDKY